MLCDFCFKEPGLFKLKNGKLCCQEKWFKCQGHRQKQREITLKKFQTDEFREKFLEGQKKRRQKETRKDKEKFKRSLDEYWKDKNNRKIHSEKIKKVWKNKEYRENLVKKHKQWWDNEENRKRASESSKLTIEQIKKRYSTFCKIEDIRYKPDLLPEKEMQVHCMLDECKNSKRNGGWFTPTRNQIGNRIESLELERGSGTSYFYCSDECRGKCCLYYLQTDPNVKKKYEQYASKVIKLTEINVRENPEKIKNLHLRGRKHKYDLDHNYSTFDGFNNNVGVEIVAHIKNLEIMSARKNRKKHRSSTITLKQLLEKIKEKE